MLYSLGVLIVWFLMVCFCILDFYLQLGEEADICQSPGGQQPTNHMVSVRASSPRSVSERDRRAGSSLSLFPTETVPCGSKCWLLQHRNWTVSRYRQRLLFCSLILPDSSVTNYKLWKVSTADVIICTLLQMALLWWFAFIILIIYIWKTTDLR